MFTVQKAKDIAGFLRKLLAETITTEFHAQGLDGFAKDLEVGGGKKEFIATVAGHASAPVLTVIKNTFGGAAPVIARTGTGVYTITFGADVDAELLANVAKIAVLTGNKTVATIGVGDIEGAGKISVKLFAGADATASDSGTLWVKAEYFQ